MLPQTIHDAIPWNRFSLSDFSWRALIHWQAAFRRFYRIYSPSDYKVQVSNKIKYIGYLGCTPFIRVNNDGSAIYLCHFKTLSTQYWHIWQCPSNISSLAVADRDQWNSHIVQEVWQCPLFVRGTLKNLVLISCNHSPSSSISVCICKIFSNICSFVNKCDDRNQNLYSALCPSTHRNQIEKIA